MADLSAHAEAKLIEVVRLLERHRVLESLVDRQDNDKRDLGSGTS